VIDADHTSKEKSKLSPGQEGRQAGRLPGLGGA